MPHNGAIAPITSQRRDEPVRIVVVSTAQIDRTEAGRDYMHGRENDQV
jgi:hypothetical protein